MYFQFGLVLIKLCEITVRHKLKMPSKPLITKVSPERTYSTKLSCLKMKTNNTPIASTKMKAC